MLSFALYTLNPQIPEETIVNDNAAAQIPVGEITDSIVVEQEIPVSDSIREISVLFATYARQNEGQILVRIEGMDSGKLYLTSILNAAEMHDNSFVLFELQEAASPKTDKKLLLSVESSSKSGSAVTIWSSASDAVPGAKLEINGSERKGDLVYKTLVVEEIDPYWNWLRIVSLCGVILGTGLLASFVIYRKRLYSFFVQSFETIGEQVLVALVLLLAAGIAALLMYKLLF